MNKQEHGPKGCLCAGVCWLAPPASRQRVHLHALGYRGSVLVEHTACKTNKASSDANPRPPRIYFLSPGRRRQGPYPSQDGRYQAVSHVMCFAGRLLRSIYVSAPPSTFSPSEVRSGVGPTHLQQAARLPRPACFWFTSCCFRLSSADPVAGWTHDLTRATDRALEI